MIESRLQDLVVITGFSGAGKSTAMNVFEDAGYFCVDNLPPEMIRSLVELFVHEGSKVERAAVVSDVRGGVYFEALRAVVDDLDALGLSHHVLFLEAAEQTLVTRYKETRRRHPLAPRGQRRGGRRRRARAARAAARPRGPGDRHDRHVGGDAAREDRRGAAAAQDRGRLAVTFMSFGFKHGPPREEDLAFDVRFLANPHYEPELRELTGLDERWSSTSPRDGRLERALRAAARAAGLPAAAVRRRGQGAPGDRDRLHRRSPPLGRDRRAPRRALPRRTTDLDVAVAHRDIDKHAPAATGPENARPSRVGAR